MYSYEARVRAVEFYIKLGRRVAKTIHVLVYPTENALKSRHRAYEQGSDLSSVDFRTRLTHTSIER
jgi:hypothetical protein